MIVTIPDVRKKFSYGFQILKIVSTYSRSMKAFIQGGKKEVRGGGRRKILKTDGKQYEVDKNF